MAYGKKKTDNDFIDTKALGNAIKTDDGSNRVYLITGEEDFFVEMSVASLKKKFIAEGSESMDYVKIDFGGKAIDVDKVQENISIPPWLSTKRLVHVNNCTFEGKDQDKIEGLINSVPSCTVLVFTVKDIDKRKKKLVSAFKANGVMACVDFMEGDQLTNWITRKVTTSGLTIDTLSCESIISRCEKSMRLITSEVSKLILFCQGSGTTAITEDIVELVCPPDMQGNIFKIMDAVGQGNPADAIIQLNNLISLKEPPIRIRVMLTRHFRQLICAKELGDARELASRIKLQDFQARKLVNQASRFTMDRLINLYNMCTTLDMDVKTGKANDQQALETFVVLACERSVAR